MSDRCGKAEDNNLALMNLVKKATEGANSPSVWELFTSHYNLSFFEYIQAAWFYWIYYQTSLISNTISAYLGSFVEHLTKDLTKENSETRTFVFSSLLQNAKEFLIDDNQAARDFSQGKDHGDLASYQNRAIERHYGFSLSELCKKFSEKRVEKSSPQVEFFKNFQLIPIIGWAFVAFQWFVNHFIIQRSMQSWILPHALESAVNKGLEATQPHNLPFTLGLTQFFTQQFEQLLGKLKNGDDSTPASVDKFPETELLSPTIKELIKAIALQGIETPLELRKKFAEIERGKNLVKDRIEKAIEEGIVHSGNLLFRYLNEVAQSGELFARLLDLATTPFSGESKSQAVLEAEYKAETAKLTRIAETVFKQIVRAAVAKKFNGVKTEDSQNIAQSLFEEQRIIVTKIANELDRLCATMTLKVAQSREEPTDENNVQTDIASLLQIMQVLAGRKELVEQLNHLKGPDRNAILGVVTPLMQRAEKIQERVLNLQELQAEYPSDANVVLHFTELGNLIRLIKGQFHAQPRHLQNPLIQSLGKTADELIRCRGAKAPLRIRLQQIINEISRLTETIVKEQQTIEAIHKLYPPRDHVEENAPQGLLDEMLSFQRGVHPRGFKPQACMDEIRKCLVHFPSEERGELERIIGDGSNLRKKWPLLAQALERIFRKHSIAKNQNKTLLDQALEKSSAWVQEKTLKYKLVKQDDHNKMQMEMSAISSEVTSFVKDVKDMDLNLSASFPSSLYGAICAVPVPALGAWLGSFLGPVLGPVGTIAGAFVGGAAGKYARGIGDKPDGSNNSMKKVAGITAAAAATYYFAPALLATAACSATGAFLGWSGMKKVQSGLENMAFNEVWGIFGQAFKLALHPRIYKAATTRTMKVLSQ
jgi:hypothetical protein